MIAKMCNLLSEDPLGFRVCAWDFVAIGLYGGFRQQEYAMDKKSDIKYYVLPDITCIARAFTIRNFILYDELGGTIYSTLEDRARCEKMGQQYDVQKNRNNSQIVCVGRFQSRPKFDPVENGFIH